MDNNGSSNLNSTVLSIMLEVVTIGMNRTHENQCRSSWSLWIYYSFSAVFLLIGLWILVANAMILYAPSVHKPLQKKSYMFVSSLAAADLMTAFLVPAAWFMGAIGQFDCDHLTRVRSNYYCAAISVFFQFPLICSELNLLLIAIDRYLALTHAVRYEELLSVRRGKILIVSVWIISAILASVNFFWNKKRDDGVMPCNGTNISPWYFHLVLGPLFWISAITILALYLRICSFVKNYQENRKGKVGKCSERDKMVTKMLFLTVVVFLVCWTPFTVCVHLTLASIISIQFVFWPLTLAYLNSGMNFFIYGARCQDYKTAFSKMIPCLKVKPPRSPTEVKEKLFTCHATTVNNNAAV